MRLKSRFRRVKMRLSRLWRRTTFRTLVRTIVVLVVAASIVSLSFAHGGWSPVVDALREWAARGWDFATGRVVLAVEADNGKLLMESVLAGYGEAAIEAEPLDGWERPLRAWAYAVTGYDFAEPRSLLEAEVGGFRRSVRLSLDIVRLPEGGLSLRERGMREEQVVGGPSQQSPAGDHQEERGDLPDEPTLESRTPQEPARDHGQSNASASRDDVAPWAAPTVGERLAALSRRDWGDGPRVLILHSHTSESYRTVPPDPRADARHHVYNESNTGITRVGKALAERLQQVYGIGTIHSTRIHNWPHHWEAYVNARDTIEEILAAYPSIDIVLDLHRQGIENAVWATSVGGVDAVSIEVIYTTSQRFQYATHPNWQRNEAFASVLARAMDEVHPGLLNRVTAVHDRRYNQDLHPHMLLLEVGNYLDLEEHAIAAARLLADAVAVALSEIQAGRIEAMLAPAAVRLPQLPKPSPSSPRPLR